MSEAQQTFANGTVRISDEVVAMIAGTAALEVDGVAPIDPADAKNKKQISRGVKIVVNEGRVYAALGVAIKQGYRIADVTRDAQEKIKAAIEAMTGMTVASIDINVMGLAGVKVQ